MGKQPWIRGPARSLGLARLPREKKLVAGWLMATFTGTIALALGGFMIVGLAVESVPDLVVIVDAAVRLLEGLADFLQKVFVPMIGVLLGFYFGRRGGSADHE